MFKELLPLLEGRTMILTAAMIGDALTVTIYPQRNGERYHIISFLPPLTKRRKRNKHVQRTTAAARRPDDDSHRGHDRRRIDSNNLSATEWREVPHHLVSPPADKEKEEE